MAEPCRRQVTDAEDAERRSFACGIGQCPNRYEDNNGLRHHRQHYAHSESQREIGQVIVEFHS